MVALPQIDIDEIPLGFGKFKGKTPKEIAEEHPSYIVWMYENFEQKRCSVELYDECILGEDTTADWEDLLW